MADGERQDESGPDFHEAGSPAIGVVLNLAGYPRLADWLATRGEVRRTWGLTQPSLR